MVISKRSPRRTGVAAVEFAVTMPLLFLLMLGTWELGRLVQVYQLLNSAVREGSRLAAQGQIIALTGSYTQIRSNTGNPNVYDTIKNTLRSGGINVSSFDSSKVAFTFLDNSGNPVATPSEPYQGTKGQRFRITATLPYNAFRWTTLNLLNVSEIQVTFDWASLIDDPFTVDENIPSWLGY